MRNHHIRAWSREIPAAQPIPPSQAPMQKMEAMIRLMVYAATGLFRCVASHYLKVECKLLAAATGAFWLVITIFIQDQKVRKKPPQ